MDSIKENFRILDFVIFGGIFAISAVVGTVFGYRDRKSQSTDNYYFGGRNMSPFPVAASISVTYISAITVLATPTEIYLFGTVFTWLALGAVASNAIAMLYYIPVFHRLRLNSIFEYLEMRFHRRLRTLASTLEVISSILYLAITVYVPSLALSAVTPLNLYTTIALTSVTCTFYTAVGGMKAVIWTDVFQSVIMIVGMMAVLIKGILVAGGVDEVVSAMERGERNNLLTFDPDPRIRGTFWTIVFGGGFIACKMIVCNQVFIQRWLSCRTIKTARTAVAISCIPSVFFILLSVGNGLVMYAHYEGCDPMMAGKISKIDQTMPLFAVELFYNTPGMAGLFVSAAFCGTLSTVSSGINSLAALAMMDFVLPIFSNLTPKRKVIFSKIFTFGFGLLVMLLSFLISLNPSNIIQLVYAIGGFLGGPILGIFTIGIFFPWINYKGAVIGFVFGVGCTTWIGLSAIFYSSSNAARLLLTTDNCPLSNISTTDTSTTATFTHVYTESNTTNISSQEEENGLTIYNTLYAISPFMYGVLGFITSITGAHLASLITGFSNPSNARSDLFVPMLDNKILPENVRKFFRFGVPDRSHVDEKMAKNDECIMLKHEDKTSSL